MNKSVFSGSGAADVVILQEAFCRWVIGGVIQVDFTNLFTPITTRPDPKFTNSSALKKLELRVESSRLTALVLCLFDFATDFCFQTRPRDRNTMAAPSDQCCTLPPFKSDYVPLGKHIKLPTNNSPLDVYVTGPAEAQNNTALVCIYGTPVFTSSKL